VAHRARDRLVRVAERRALLDQVIGKVGRRRVAFARRRAHARCVDPDAGGDEVVITARVSASVSTVSNSGSLSSWLSLL